MFGKDPDHTLSQPNNTDIVLCCIEPYICSRENDSGIRCCTDRIFRKSFAPVCRDTSYRTADPDDHKVQSYVRD